MLRGMCGKDVNIDFFSNYYSWYSVSNFSAFTPFPEMHIPYTEIQVLKLYFSGAAFCLQGMDLLWI